MATVALRENGQALGTQLAGLAATAQAEAASRSPKSVLDEIAALAQDVGMHLPPGLVSWISAAERTRDLSKEAGTSAEGPPGKSRRLQESSKELSQVETAAAHGNEAASSGQKEEERTAGSSPRSHVKPDPDVCTSGVEVRGPEQAVKAENFGEKQDGELQESENLHVLESRRPHSPLLGEEKQEDSPSSVGAVYVEVDTPPGRPTSPVDFHAPEDLCKEVEPSVAAPQRKRAREALCREEKSGILTEEEVKKLIDRNKELLGMLAKINKLRAGDVPTNIELEFAAETYSNLVKLAGSTSPHHLASKVQIQKTLLTLGLRDPPEQMPPKPQSLRKKYTKSVADATATAVHLAKVHRIIATDADRQRKQQQKEQTPSQGQTTPGSGTVLPQLVASVASPLLVPNQPSPATPQTNRGPGRPPQTLETHPPSRPTSAASTPSQQVIVNNASLLIALEAQASDISRQLEQIDSMQQQIAQRQALLHQQLAAGQQRETLLLQQPLTPHLQQQLHEVGGQLALVRASLAKWQQDELRLVDLKRGLIARQETLHQQQMAARPRAVPLSAVEFPVACVICGQVESQTDALLICDTCEKPHHLRCLQPPPRVRTDAEWACASCMAQRHPRPRTAPPPGPSPLQPASGRLSGTPPVQAPQQPGPANTPPGSTPVNPALGTLQLMLALRARQLGTPTPLPLTATPPPEAGTHQAPPAPPPGPLVQWVDPPLRQEENRTFYSRCLVDGREYAVKRCALFRPDKPGVPPYLGRVQALWSGPGLNEYWVRVSWFYYPHDIPPTLPRPPLEVPEEVYESNHSDNNLVGSIQGPCVILPPGEYAKEKERRQQAGNDGPLFLCRYLYDALHGRFVELQPSPPTALAN